MRSMNVYLTGEQRQEALCLNSTLRFAERLVKSGQKNADSIKRSIISLIKRNKSAKIDYVAIVTINDLMAVKRITKQVLIALAVYFGKTRLIDNVLVKPKP